jgi:hypothetical protein
MSSIQTKNAFVSNFLNQPTTKTTKQFITDFRNNVPKLEPIGKFLQGSSIQKINKPEKSSRFVANPWKSMQQGAAAYLEQFNKAHTDNIIKMCQKPAYYDLEKSNKAHNDNITKMCKSKGFA